MRRFAVAITALAVLALSMTACAQESIPPPSTGQIKLYTASATVNCPALATYADVRLFGPSGGGGGGSSTLGGGGGGDGAFIECVFKCSSGALSISLGIAGSAGPAGTTNCTDGGLASSNLVSQGTRNCSAGGANGGVGSTCGGGAGGTFAASGGGVGAISFTNGSGGSAGSGATPGTAGNSGLAGGTGGAPSQPGTAGQRGFASVIFY